MLFCQASAIASAVGSIVLTAVLSHVYLLVVIQVHLNGWGVFLKYMRFYVLP